MLVEVLECHCFLKIKIASLNEGIFPCNAPSSLFEEYFYQILLVSLLASARYVVSVACVSDQLFPDCKTFLSNTLHLRTLF